MKPINWFAIIVVATVVGAGIWVTLGPSIDSGSSSRAESESPDAQAGDDPQAYPAESVASSPVSPSEQTGAETPGETPPAEPDSRLAIMRDVEAARSASERAEALARLREIDPVLAETKLLALAQGCSPIHLDSREGVEAKRDVVEQLRDWCDGLEVSAETVEARLAELKKIDEDIEGDAAYIERLARNPFIGRRYEMEERLANAEDEGRSDQFTEYLRRAPDFEVIMTLMSLNSSHARDNGGRPLWKLGLESHARLYPQAELLEAQRTAMMLFGCNRFGGCQAGQYTTMFFCLNSYFGRCPPGTSLYEQIYQTTSPANYGLAREILSHI